MHRLLVPLLLVIAGIPPAHGQTSHALHLPWPVVGGTVTERYGYVATSAQLGLDTPNPGIIIATMPAERVHSVEAGTVVKADVLPEYGRYVFLRHGDTMTVYGNLSSVAVGVGDVVGAGQVIGRAGTEADPKGAALFFAVFRGNNTLDPLVWLRRE